MKFFEINSVDNLASLVRQFAATAEPGQDLTATVSGILAAVRQDGDAACTQMTEKFDGVRLAPDEQEISEKDWHAAAATVDEKLANALSLAAKNISLFHREQRQKSWQIERDGVILGQRVLPIERVGIYVPGGRAKYPSTVLMTALPAKIAGVGEIIMVSPPDRESGTIDPVLLLAAKLAGVDRIFQIGGAQAIAALTFGTEHLPAVDKIVGPGNAFVAEAKRQVFGKVGIDLIAGPSEVAIFVDDTTNCVWVVRDLFAQMEHDPQARCLVISLDAAKAQEIIAGVEAELADAPRREIITQAWQNNTVIASAQNKELAVAALNAFAAEHLQLMTQNPHEILPQIKHAGAIFLGQYSPVPMGDYMAGPNHTLPTGGSARFASALGVYDFIRHQDIIEYEAASWQREALLVDRLARAENLPNHALSAMARQEDGQ